MNQKRVAFYTLGCKLNFAETSSIGRLLNEQGYKTVKFEERSDLFVINTCSVTDNADKKCRKVIKQALRSSPHANVIVTGCYAQLKPDEIAKIPGVNLVLGASEKFEIVNYLDRLGEGGYGHTYVSSIEEANSFSTAFSLGERTRSYLKVQDGCDYSCSFCTIPLARGRSRSIEIPKIIDQAKDVAARGVKEIVLTGVNIGDYGKGIPNAQPSTNFFNLVKELDHVEGIKRYRISSIEPNLLNNDIIEFVGRSRRFMPHFHIPLQSGSNKILGLMRRRYRRELYQNRIKCIKEIMPHCGIGVDVIVGFPGETKDDFMDTYNFLNTLDVSYLHVFTYSERPNTDAVNFRGSVSTEDRKERSQMLRGLSVKKRRAFYESYLGSKQKVLFEDHNEQGWMKGFTENYIKVRVPYDPILANQINEVRLASLDSSGEVLISEPNRTLVH